MLFTEMSTYPSFTQGFGRVRVRLGLVNGRLPAQPEAVVQRAHGELGVLRGDEAARP